MPPSILLHRGPFVPTRCIVGWVAGVTMSR